MNLNISITVATVTADFLWENKDLSSLFWLLLLGGINRIGSELRG